MYKEPFSLIQFQDSISICQPYREKLSLSLTFWHTNTNNRVHTQYTHIEMAFYILKLECYFTIPKWEKRLFSLCAIYFPCTIIYEAKVQKRIRLAIEWTSGDKHLQNEEQKPGRNRKVVHTVVAVLLVDKTWISLPQNAFGMVLVLVLALRFLLLLLLLALIPYSLRSFVRWCPKLQIMLQCQESAHYSKFLRTHEKSGK